MLKLAGLSPHSVEVLGALGSARSGSRTEDSTQQPDEGAPGCEGTTGEAEQGNVVGPGRRLGVGAGGQGTCLWGDSHLTKASRRPGEIDARGPEAAWGPQAPRVATRPSGQRGRGKVLGPRKGAGICFSVTVDGFEQGIM